MKWYIGSDALGSYVFFQSDKEPEKMYPYGYICHGATYLNISGPYDTKQDAKDDLESSFNDPEYEQTD